MTAGTVYRKLLCIVKLLQSSDSDVTSAGNKDFSLNIANANSTFFQIWQEDEKPGECPPVTNDTVGTCIEMCTSDDECTGDEKCCSNGCGRVCLNPVGEKPGQCPVHEGPGPCYIGCDDDFSCTGDEKCCFNGCGRNCMPPDDDPPKPGQCPVISNGTIGPCLIACRNDSSCPGNKKCCFNGCGVQCMMPQCHSKQGQCPRKPSNKSCKGHWRCTTDCDCPRNMKCCQTGRKGCSRTCQLPIA